MNPTAIAYAVQLVGALPGLIQAGVDITRTLREGQSKLQQFEAEGRNPTPQEWDALNAEIARLRGELHAPD
jgi:hypothetical protein